jgi:hypothetical protein
MIELVLGLDPKMLSFKTSQLSTWAHKCYSRVSFLAIGIFDTADNEDFLLIFTLNFAFLSGSSRHGNDFLAPVVSNWVTPNHETLPSGFVY